MKPQGKHKAMARSCRNTQMREANLQEKALPESVRLAFVSSPDNLTATEERMTSEVVFYFSSNIFAGKY